LNGLKNWLRKNILPLSTNILDITGVAETSNTTYYRGDCSYITKKVEVERNSTAVNFVLKETQNIGENYFLTIDFYTINPNFNPENGWNCKIKTFSKNINNELICEQYFDFYKTDLESITISYNKNVDPYLSVETTIYDNNGFGMNYKIMRNMQIARNYYLINNNLNTYLNGIDYLYVGGNKGLYYFYDENGFMFVNEKWLDDSFNDI
jgi:hypothetical protein